MARCSMVVCAMVSAVLMLAASASAQTSATDQYLREGTVTTTTSSGVAGETDAGTDGGSLPAGAGTNGGGGGGGTDGGSLSTGAGTSGGGGGGLTGGGGGTAGGGGGAGAAVTTTRVLSLSFGTTTPKDLKDDIDAALTRAGLTPGPAGEIPQKAVEDFLGSDLAKTLAAGGGPEAVGRAVAAALLHPGALTAGILQALLIDPEAITGPATHVILTRSAPATGDYGRFIKGLVGGFDPVPRVYVETSEATTSFVTAFADLGVPTVDDLDKAAGKAAFAAILVHGAVGNFGAKPTADSKLTPTGVQPISARIPEPGDGSISRAMPYLLLLTLVFGALLWALPALRRGPFRHRSG